MESCKENRFRETRHLFAYKATVIKYTEACCLFSSTLLIPFFFFHLRIVRWEVKSSRLSPLCSVQPTYVTLNWMSIAGSKPNHNSYIHHINTHLFFCKNTY